MWARFRHYFKGFPAQEKVAQLMVMYGLRVHDGSVFAAEIKLSDTSMARAAGVDRRVVTATVDTIDKNDELRSFVDALRPGRHLRVVAFQSLLSPQPLIRSALEKAQHPGGPKSPEARALRESYYLLAKVLWTRRASIRRIHDLAWLDHTVVSAGARLGRVWENSDGSRSIRAAEETLPPGISPEPFPQQGVNWIQVPRSGVAGINPNVKLERGVSNPFRVGIVPEVRLRPWYEAVTTAKFKAPPAAVSVLGEIEALIAAARRAGGSSVALVFAASSFEDRLAE